MVVAGLSPSMYPRPIRLPVAFASRDLNGAGLLGSKINMFIF